MPKLKYLYLIFLLECVIPAESVFQYHKLVLEPIFRFTETSSTPMKSIYFTKLPQYSSVTQNSEKLNLTQFPAVRGSTQEMFLKDLNCGVDTCQNLPFKVAPIFNVIDSRGRLKFETSPSASDTVLGKAGYVAPEEHGGLVRYDEYYSEDVDLFAYTNGQYPNQFGACQLRDYGRYRYKFVRTLGYAFTAVTVPENLPIYSIFGYDDGLPEPTTVIPTTISLGTNQYIFKTNPIWTILKNSTNGTQGAGAINLPWTPPVSASPIEPTNVCLLNGNISVLSKCGQVDRMLQFYDKTHVYIGFIDSVYGSTDTFIYSYIGYAFRSEENACDIPLKPIREFYKDGVGNTVFAGEDYTSLTSSGFLPTGNIIGYTIDCRDAPDGQIIVTVPDGLTSTPPSTFSSESTTSSSKLPFYVEPVKIVGPPASGGEQGYFLDPEDGVPSDVQVLDTSNVCLFTANFSDVSRCGYASSVNLYYDVIDNFYFVGLYTFGRNVTEKFIGLAFEEPENVCGLSLVPIRELYKDGVGYSIVAGDDYSSLLADGYNITGNIVGYTVDCKDARNGLVFADMPDFTLETRTTLTTSTEPASESTSESTTSENPSTTSPDPGEPVVPILIIEKPVTSGEQGYFVGSPTPSPTVNASNVCLFSANSTVYTRCGLTKTLYTYYDIEDEFYFVGTERLCRNVTETEVGRVFESEENVCGLDLMPIRELYKDGVGYTVVAGDDYGYLINDGYRLTENIMGYTIDCKDSTNNHIHVDIPDHDFTTHAPIPGSPIPESESIETTSIYVQPLTVMSWFNGHYGFRGFPYSANQKKFAVCIFIGNETFLAQCGDTKPLYQFDVNNTELYTFVGLSDLGRVNAKSMRRLGVAFTSEENRCGLKLRPMRELHKPGYGYRLVAGDDYASDLAEGFVLTGVIHGYTVRCRQPSVRNICAFVPELSSTTTSTTETTDTTMPGNSGESSTTMVSTVKPAESSSVPTEKTSSTSTENGVTTSPSTTKPTTSATTTTAIPGTTTPYDLEAPLPKLNCDVIKNYGDLRWRMVQFERYMEVGDNFTMTGHIWPNVSESNVNLYVGGNPKWLSSYISIHITMRWWRNDIIYNYFWGKWNYAYETFSSRPFAKGMPYVLSIVRQSNYYDVYGNGQFIKKYWIVGTVSLHQVGGMMGYREWTIDSVQMDCARPPNTTPTTPSTTSTISAASTTPYDHTVPLPILNCNTISNYGNLRDRAINFSRVLEVGDNITLTGYIWPNASESNVNFYTGFNPVFEHSVVPVHITQRWWRTDIIYNNWNGAWSKNEAYSSRPFTRGQPFVLSVVRTPNAHYVYGNGKELIRFWLRGSAAENRIGSMIVYREWTIDSVTMTCVNPTTPTTSTTPTTTTTTTRTSTSTTLTSTTTTPATTTTTPTSTSSTGTTPTTTVTSTTTKSIDPEKCRNDLVTLGKGDSNDPQINIDANYGLKIGTGNRMTLQVYCQGLSGYNIYMIFNVNQGGPAPSSTGYQDVTLECSLLDENSVWTFSGRPISNISCQQVPG